jgi:hypothetical protein
MNSCPTRWASLSEPRTSPAQSAAADGLAVGLALGATVAVGSGVAGMDGAADAGPALGAVVADAVVAGLLALGDSWTTLPMQPARSMAHSQVAVSGRSRDRASCIVLIVPCEDGSCRRSCDAAAR